MYVCLITIRTTIKVLLNLLNLTHMKLVTNVNVFSGMLRVELHVLYTVHCTRSCSGPPCPLPLETKADASPLAQE